MAALKKFFSPPVFPTEDDTRVAKQLSIILWITAGLLGSLFVVLVISYNDLFSNSPPVVGGLALSMVGLYVILRRGYIRVASYLYLIISWSGLSYIAWAIGIRDVVFIAYFVIIMAAGLLLGWREVIFFSVSSILAGWGLAYAESSGLITPRLDKPYDFARDATVIFILASSLLYLMVNNLRQNLQQARRSNQELASLSAKLEDRVAASTQKLNLAAEIGLEVTQVRGLEHLLPLATQRIYETFDLYQVQIYLLDKSETLLQLRASSGHAGSRLLEAGHQLLLNQSSLNTTAVIQKKPIIVADTAQDPLFRPHPLLPETRSELTLPLLVGNRVLGVLDLQSNRIGDLTEESLPAFNILAGQLATAIENEYQKQIIQQALQEVEYSRQFLSIVLNNIPNPIFYKDQEGLYLGFNQAFLDYLGKPAEALLGKSVFDLQTDPELAKKYHAMDVQLMENPDEPQIYESQVIYADGSLRDVIFHKKAIRYADGSIGGLVGLILDVTETKRTQAALNKLARELQTVAEISTKVATFQDEQQLLQEVVNLTKEHFNLYHAQIYLLDEAHEQLILKAGAGEIGRSMAAEGHAIPLNQEGLLVVRAAHQLQSLIVNDVQADAGFVSYPLLPDTRSEMVIPMISAGQLLGVLDLQADTVDRFTAQDVQIQTTLMAQTAVALQNTRQYRQTQTALKKTQILLNLASIASGSLALEETLVEVLRQVLSLRQAEAGLISIVDQKTGSLKLVAQQLPQELYHSFMKNGLNGTLCDLVYRSGQALTLVDLEQETPVDVSVLIARGFRSYQGVPIEVHGEVLGTICIFSSQQLEKGEEFELLIAIGQEVGVTVQNAMLFSQTEAALAETNVFRRLFEALNQGVAIAELDGAISYANPALLRFLGFDDLAQLQGESITNFYPGEIRITAELEAIPTALEKGGWSGEMVLQAPDGREIPTLESYTLITNEAGEPIYLALVFTDITERKEAEKAQQRLAAALEERLQEVKILQRAMTHERWQAFFAARERLIQGYHFQKEKLRLISQQEVDTNELTNMPMSSTQATQIVTSGAETTAAVPMQIQGETIGVLGARSLDGKPINAETRKLLATISAEVAEALERARLFEETELSRQQLNAQARELAVINEVAQSVSQLLQPADLLETIFRQVQRAITADAFIVATYDERTNTMNYPLVYDEGRRYQPVPGRPAADNPWLQVVQSGKPILINRTHAEVAERLAQLKGQAEQRLGQPGKVSASLMFVPLFLGQKTIGAMSVQSYTRAAYNERDLALLTGIANHVAVALENARLYTEAQRRAEREALVNTITQKIQSTLTVEKALETAVTELGRVFQAPYAAAEIALAGQENGRINPSHVKE